MLLLHHYCCFHCIRRHSQQLLLTIAVAITIFLSHTSLCSLRYSRVLYYTIVHYIIAPILLRPHHCAYTIAPTLYYTIAPILLPLSVVCAAAGSLTKHWPPTTLYFTMLYYTLRCCTILYYAIPLPFSAGSLPESLASAGVTAPVTAPGSSSVGSAC